MQIKDRVVTKIESVAFGGEGVGRVDNFVVFIPFAAPEDELEVEIVQLKKKFARGKILQIVKPSPMRINPFCRYYENCGGCCYQHLNYEYQLEIKKKQVEEIFRKIGKIATPPVGKTIASSNVYNYRGKAELHSSITSNGCKIGFLDVSGGEIVDIERCEIMEETINDKLRILRQNKQQLRNNDARLTIWSGLLADQKGTVTRVVRGRTFLVPRRGFFQANLYLTDQLVDEVCRLAESQEMNTLIDAYCGSGLFSIFLAPYAQSVVGIEISEKSVKYAQTNAANADVKNVRFVHGKVENILPGKFLSSKKEINLLVLDPPRSGCSESVLRAIADLKPQKVIYVSCNPATQARDVKYLNEQGYELLSLMPMDMFPQTEHIETIGFLVLK
ncbi:MAG: 23S rRNA (uracil(1939)-C(5))-methyltransferase RlmD [Smithellaceae bacterium]